MKTEVKVGLGLGAVLIAIIGAAYVFMPAPTPIASTNTDSSANRSNPLPEAAPAPSTMPASTLPSVLQTPSTLPSMGSSMGPAMGSSMTGGTGTLTTPSNSMTLTSPSTMPSTAGGMGTGMGSTGMGTGTTSANSPSAPVDWNSLLAGSSTAGNTSASSSSNSLTSTGSLPPSVGGMTSHKLGASDAFAGATPATYTIKAGDTLASISSNVYGSPNYWSKIVQANSGLNPNRLKVGQVIKIPEQSDVKPSASSAPKPEKVSGSALVKDPKSEYQVVAGDTLEKISTKLYGSPSRWKEIFALNKAKLGKPSNLKVGQTLKLPSAPASSDEPKSTSDRPEHSSRSSHTTTRPS